MWEWLKSNDSVYAFMAVSSICSALTIIGAIRIMDRAETMLSKMIGASDPQSLSKNGKVWSPPVISAPKDNVLE